MRLNIFCKRSDRVSQPINQVVKAEGTSRTWATSDFAIPRPVKRDKDSFYTSLLRTLKPKGQVGTPEAKEQEEKKVKGLREEIAAYIDNNKEALQAHPNFKSVSIDYLKQLVEKGDVPNTIEGNLVPILAAKAIGRDVRILVKSKDENGRDIYREQKECSANSDLPNSGLGEASYRDDTENPKALYLLKQGDYYDYFVSDTAKDVDDSVVKNDNSSLRKNPQGQLGGRLKISNSKKSAGQTRRSNSKSTPQPFIARPAGVSTIRSANNDSNSLGDVEAGHRQADQASTEVILGQKNNSELLVEGQQMGQGRARRNQGHQANNSFLRGSLSRQEKSRSVVSNQEVSRGQENNVDQGQAQILGTEDNQPVAIPRAFNNKDSFYTSLLETLNPGDKINTEKKKKRVEDLRKKIADYISNNKKALQTHPDFVQVSIDKLEKLVKEGGTPNTKEGNLVPLLAAKVSGCNLHILAESKGEDKQCIYQEQNRCFVNSSLPAVDLDETRKRRDITNPQALYLLKQGDQYSASLHGLAKYGFIDIVPSALDQRTSSSLFRSDQSGDKHDLIDEASPALSQRSGSSSSSSSRSDFEESDWESITAGEDDSDSHVPSQPIMKKADDSVAKNKEQKDNSSPRGALTRQLGARFTPDISDQISSPSASSSVDQGQAQLLVTDAGVRKTGAVSQRSAATLSIQGARRRAQFIKITRQARGVAEQAQHNSLSNGVPIRTLAKQKKTRFTPESLDQGVGSSRSTNLAASASEEGINPIDQRREKSEGKRCSSSYLI